jgi:AcrR family transcriptional regulator
MAAAPFAALGQNRGETSSRALMTGDGRMPRIGRPDVYRVFPRQLRSREAVAGMLSAARSLSHTGTLELPEIALQTGCSAAAIYRYFDSVVALRVALASQELELYFDAITVELESTAILRWQDVVLLHLSIRLDSYAVRGGPASISERYWRTSNESEVIASFLTEEICARFAPDLSARELFHRVEMTIRIIDALTDRACRETPSRKWQILADCRAVVESYLV